MGMHITAMKASHCALVLKEKKINIEGPCYVHLSGRKPGFWAWLLTLLGVNPTTTLEIYEDRIEFSSSTLSGFIRETVPIANVSNMVFAYFKPILLIVFAIIFIVVGIALFCVGFLELPSDFVSGLRIAGGLLFIVAIIMLCVYAYKKTTILLIVPNSALAIAIAFKRSGIENQNISTEDTENIVKIINRLVSQNNKSVAE